tara:strand:+ start:144 stop:998 length:855 start_codon:yes stop_codon:yes gene_type:complete
MKFEDALWIDEFSLLTLKGEGVREFLHGQTTADIRKAGLNNFIRCFWLSTSGEIRCLLEIVMKENGADVLVLFGNQIEIWEGFNNVIFPADKVDLEPVKLIRRVQKLSFEKSWKESEVKWLNNQENLPEELLSLTIANEDEYNKWRFIQGYIFDSKEINFETNPFEIGLNDLISLDKGCYLGQEKIARLIRSDFIKKELRYWECDDIILDEEELLNNPRIVLGDNFKIAGYIISTINKLDKSSCGLAMIKNAYLDSSDLFILGISKKIRIKLPIGFYSNVNRKF